METASVVFDHNFDADMLDEIQTLRAIRLTLTEKMLRDLAGTATALKERGLVGENAIDQSELRRELHSRAADLRQRILQPKVVYADEISMYVDLLGDDMASIKD